MSKIEKLKSALKSKDGKVLASNFAYLSLLQIAGYVFPLITIPYLARVIGVDGFGKIAFASAVIVWIQTIADWGFNFTATRDVARNRDNAAIVSKIFSNVLWARLLLMCFSLAVLLILIALIPDFRENADVILVTFLLVPGHILFPEWFFQAMERMRYITILNLLSKLVFTVAVFLFVKTKDDYILQPLLISLGYILSGIIALYVILYKWGYKVRFTSVGEVFQTINKSKDVFLNSIFPNFYASLSTILLGVFCGSTANGIYEAGHKFFAICNQLMITISRTFFPFLSRKIDKHKLYARMSISLSIIMSVTLFVMAPLLIEWFFTSEFIEAVNVLRLLAILIIILTIIDVYGKNYMIVCGYDRQLRNITIICSIIGFAISIPLIYYYSYIGKSLILLITNGLLAFSSMSYVKRLKCKR